MKSTSKDQSCIHWSHKGLQAGEHDRLFKILTIELAAHRLSDPFMMIWKALRCLKALADKVEWSSGVFSLPPNLEFSRHPAETVFWNFNQRNMIWLKLPQRCQIDSQDRWLRDFPFNGGAVVDTLSADELQQFMNSFRDARKDCGLTISLNQNTMRRTWHHH